MVTFFRLLATVLLMALFGVGYADDKKALQLKAKAALALADGSPRVSKAPTPRAVEPRDYATGYNKSLVDQKPLVVFIGCEASPMEGAICSQVNGPNFGSYKGPAVVVCYPTADRLNFDSVLPCPPDPAALKKAVHDAARKIDKPAPKQMPAAPKPQEWKVHCEYVVSPGGVLYRQ